MIKVAAFDLDGTLAKLGRGITPENIERLRKLEALGIRIVICSGKPTYYLCGFLRQTELKAPILSGENGAVLQYGVDLPPKKYEILPYDKAADLELRYVREEIDRRISGLWYQPNEVGLTPFPGNEEEFSVIQSFLDENREKLTHLEIFRHIDSFDLTPAGVNKYAGMQFLGNLLGVDAGEIAAVGDGVNDYPMFAYAGYSIGIGPADPDKTTDHFETIEEGLEFLLKKIEKERTNTQKHMCE